jgi:iron complex outermembrane receptor protein
LGGAPLFARLASSPNFESEELLAYELGYRTQATDKFSADIASFYNVYDKLRVAVPGAVIAGAMPGSFDLPLTFQNRMKGETYGVELSAAWQLSDWLRLYGTYTFQKINLHADPILPAGTRTGAEAAEGQSPPHQVYLRSSWNMPRQVQLDLIGRFVDRLHGFNPGGVGDVIDQYSSLDARLSYPVRKNLELAVMGQNLLDNLHPETGTAQFLKSSPVQIRRGVYGKVVWSF